MAGVVTLGLLFGGFAGVLAQDPEEEPGPQPPMEVPSGPRIARAAICTGVVDREPVGEGNRFGVDVGRLYCYTEILDGAGKEVTHFWTQDGQNRARVAIEVGANRWRSWSTKTIDSGSVGTWEVKVLDADGIVLDTLEFVVE
jgi:hypothetical protein